MKSKATLIREWKKGREEINTLDMLASTTRPRVAEKLGISRGALTQRLETIKMHVILWGWYMDEVKKLKKLSPYIVGLLAPKKPDVDDLEGVEV